ncbi:single-stranded-DNA-specific exonuclease RecJ [Comamonas thiooxydans]|uniref:single-stranded-DNA-specific exonuclease RecJ n=1 Tax=Comamonas thiooxydans TaxID=363952 RepID=UPI000B40F5BA|nr:DHHA1 domain-containing protein [Comamonas thiooxydans]
MSLELKVREVNGEALASLKQAHPDFTELEIKLMAARGAVPHNQTLSGLLGRRMVDLDRGATRLAHAIKKKEKIVVIADYDCDGATACAVSVAGLRALGADVSYVVPDRLVHGYGISPSVVDMAVERFPQVRVLMTVDNGILGHAGINHAVSLDIDLVVTDHHLPGDDLPSNACAVIDPSRKDDNSGLEKLAGVSVALWTVVETKRVLAEGGVETPKLNFLLPYVAIGTVADMVPLDEVNRQLVNIGLDRMRRGDVPPGVAALLAEAGAMPAYITTQDIGFGIGPRINAAGRLDTMDAGIELLLATDPKEAKRLARTLTDTNEARKRLQKEATADANLNLEGVASGDSMTIVKGSTEWHPGIVGLVASRLKDTYFRPTFIFSLMADEHGEIKVKGSGRSIPGFHLKDALEEVARRAPGLLTHFGGHAMAAGAGLSGPGALDEFGRVFDQVARDRILPSMLESVLLSDGSVPALTLEGAARILRHPWGQHFESPAFDDVALITNKKALGQSGQHWRVEALLPNKNTVEVVLFNQDEPAVGKEAHLYVQPGLNTWQGRTRLQWLGKVLG